MRRFTTIRRRAISREMDRAYADDTTQIRDIDNLEFRTCWCYSRDMKRIDENCSTGLVNHHKRMVA